MCMLFQVPTDVINLLFKLSRELASIFSYKHTLILNCECALILNCECALKFQLWAYTRFLIAALYGSLPGGLSESPPQRAEKFIWWSCINSFSCGVECIHRSLTLRPLLQLHNTCSILLLIHFGALIHDTTFLILLAHYHLVWCVLKMHARAQLFLDRHS